MCELTIALLTGLKFTYNVLLDLQCLCIHAIRLNFSFQLDCHKDYHSRILDYITYLQSLKVS